MKTRVTQDLIGEARAYELRWACEHCAHFDVVGERCGNGWPTREHRLARLRGGESIAFCKEFEG